MCTGGSLSLFDTSWKIKKEFSSSGQIIRALTPSAFLQFSFSDQRLLFYSTGLINNVS